MLEVSIAETKGHLSELIAKSAYAGERFVITKRNKPVAALVSLEAPRIIEQHEQHEQRQGFASIAGKWKDFEEVGKRIEDLRQLRNDSGTRSDVSF
ncbi:type II toxin-antitoxin system Phd/YefM family antitoxin [Desulfonatronum thioautotrophicum]|uniref:type II toxin-antitoxin system Phd/YefM family antitoxin n=1 Tax=Desulfonatronum thioautotrophicum TaxID=617001 RepID=UPI0005EBB7F8|nr:type II toxin-antitoxin system Phd/YefM family antitoxin [Desulfonatronum thioautotrophicum]